MVGPNCFNVSITHPMHLQKAPALLPISQNSSHALLFILLCFISSHFQTFALKKCKVRQVLASNVTSWVPPFAHQSYSYQLPQEPLQTQHAALLGKGLRRLQQSARQLCSACSDRCLCACVFSKYLQVRIRTCACSPLSNCETPSLFAWRVWMCVCWRDFDMS